MDAAQDRDDATIRDMAHGVEDGHDRLRIAMVAYADISYDSRVQREAASLAEAGHRVTLFCLPGSREPMAWLDPRVAVVMRRAMATDVVPRSPSPFRSAVPGSPLRQVRERAAWVWNYARNVRSWGAAVIGEGGPFDIWHAHDFAGLVAIGGRGGPHGGVVYDVHDIFLESGTAARLPKPARWALRRYERRLARRAEAVVTVNSALAEVLQQRYRPRSVVVVHNCAPRWVVPDPRPDLIRESAGIPAHVPVVLYHGVLGQARGIDTLCEAMLEPSMRDTHVALMGFGLLRESLAALAGEPRFGGRLHVLDPVPPANLLPWVASADVGALSMPPANLNLYLSTPNKLFECLAAGTPVVVSDFPAVRQIVMDDELGPLGATCRPSDPRELAQAISSIVRLDAASRADLRARCAAAARSRWNWETEAERLLTLYEGLAVRPRPTAAGAAR